MKPWEKIGVSRSTYYRDEKIARERAMTYKSDVADYDLIYISNIPKGIWVKNSDEGEDFFLPDSQIEYDPTKCIRNKTISVTIPEWLAEKHDLL